MGLGYVRLAQSRTFISEIDTYKTEMTDFIDKTMAGE